MKKALLVMRTGAFGLFLLFCCSTTHTFFSIGHRGAKGHAPENTLAAFERAIALGADMVELDVHVCASGEIVVVHDACLADVGYVAEASLAQLQSLDRGQGQKIPTLEQVCTLIDHRIKINIELKGAGTAEPVAFFIKGLVEDCGWAYGDFFVSSFNHRWLQEFSSLLPSVEIGALLFGPPIDFIATVKKIPARAIVINKDFVNQALIDEIHDFGMSVFVFTANHHVEIARVKQLGVDGVISDYPDRL